jgi:uncharacterized protein with HEPN domain
VPSKDPLQRFEDIIENILLIEEFTRGMDLNAFLDDLKTRNATERCMERISEAARKLGGLADDRIDVARVWLMVEDDLGPLKSATEQALARLRQAEG